MNTLQPLSHQRNFARPSLFYRQSKCSKDLHQLVLPFQAFRCRAHNAIFTLEIHPHFVHVPLIKIKFHSESNIPRIVTFQNRLTREGFTDCYNRNLFKLRLIYPTYIHNVHILLFLSQEPRSVALYHQLLLNLILDGKKETPFLTDLRKYFLSDFCFKCFQSVCRQLFHCLIAYHCFSSCIFLHKPKSQKMAANTLTSTDALPTVSTVNLRCWPK